MTVTVLVEVPRGGFVKRRADGSVDYVSPLPCPFAYGCVPDREGGDGDPLDAVLLGGPRRRGDLVPTEVRATVRFLDAGRTDDKLVCGDHVPSRAERWLVIGFFRGYAVAKGLLNRARGQAGRTAFLGWVPA